MDGWMAGWMAGWTAGWMNERLDGRMAAWLAGWPGRKDGWMDARCLPPCSKCFRDIRFFLATVHAALREHRFSVGHPDNNGA